MHSGCWKRLSRSTEKRAPNTYCRHNAHLGGERRFVHREFNLASIATHRLEFTHRSHSTRFCRDQKGILLRVAIRKSISGRIHIVLLFGLRLTFHLWKRTFSFIGREKRSFTAFSFSRTTENPIDSVSYERSEMETAGFMAMGTAAGCVKVLLFTLEFSELLDDD